MAALAPAQQAKLGVKGIEPNDDVIYGSLIREDANGIPAAVVRVKLPIEGAAFDGDFIGDPLFDVNEYIVWLEAGCRMESMFLPKEKKMQRDYKEAAHWYEMTIKNAPAGDKSTLSDALCNLGIYYLEGKGVVRDERKGAELLERAAALGDIIAALRLKNLSQSKGSE